MTSSEKTKQLVFSIKEQEEKEYGISLNIETPTVIEYYKNNLTKGKFDLKRNVNIILRGLEWGGFSSTKSTDICIFNKNHDLILFVYSPLKYLTNDIDYQNAVISLITYHEIRHILQYQKPELFTSSEQFLNYYLSNADNLKLLYSKRHNSLYNEIDANLYAAQKSKLLFKDNEKMSNYFERIINNVSFKKVTYDFELFFGRFVNNLQKNGFNDGYDEDEFFKIFWNKDGSFKKVSEIIKNQSFLPDNKLSVMILGSNSFLSFVSNKKLSSEELDVIIYEIELNKFMQNKKKEKITQMFDCHKIDKKMYNSAIKGIDAIISKKQVFEETIEKGSKKESETSVRSSI